MAGQAPLCSTCRTVNRPGIPVGKSTRTGRHGTRPAYAGPVTTPAPRRTALPRREPPRTVAPDWPDTPATDPATETIRAAVASLAAEIDTRGLSLRAAAEQTGIPATTLLGVLRGDHWPDALTIAKAETALDAPLWPRHG